MKKLPFADLGQLNEDQRVQAIGDQVALGKTVGFVTDADPGKADRYIAKLKLRFPNLQVLGTFPGPVAGAVTVKVSNHASRN